MASVVTPAVRIHRTVKSKDTDLPNRGAVLLETHRYAFYFPLLYRVFQLESRPHTEYRVLYFSTSEALSLSCRLQHAVFSNMTEN